MEKSKLYTSTGDGGTTSLCGGERIAKDSERLEAYGTVDEFSAFLGELIADSGCPDDIRQRMLQIQNRLFDISAYLASDPDSKVYRCPHTITDEVIGQLEYWTDEADAEAPKIREFVLSGGSMTSARAHVARTVCRRAERRILALSRTAEVSPAVLRYFNRLSDLLFIWARLINHRAGIKEVTWQKNQ